jgi:hypothetical protein
VPAFIQKYSDEAKEAMYQASIARGLSYRRITELAAAGELTATNGDKIPPFEISIMYLGELVRTETRRRTGRAAADVAKLAPRDGVEAMRRRGLSAADHMQGLVERKLQRLGKDADMAQLREIAKAQWEITRVMREVAHLPGPTDPRPPKPGQKVNGERSGGDGNPNGKTMRDMLIADARRSNGSADAQTAPPRPMHTDHAAEEHTHAEPAAAQASSGSRIAMRAMP